MEKVTKGFPFGSSGAELWKISNSELAYAKAEHRGFRWGFYPTEVYEESTPTSRSGGLENQINDKKSM